MKPKSKQLGGEPAFPVSDLYDGMSKRYYTAVKVMQAMINTTFTPAGFMNGSRESAVEMAYLITDELIKQEKL